VYDTNLNYVTVTGDTVELIILEEGFTYTYADGWTSETNAAELDDRAELLSEAPRIHMSCSQGDYLAYSAHTLNGNGNLTAFVSPTLDFSGMDSAKLTFWFINKAWSNDFDSVYLLFRIDGGDWNSVYAIESAHDNWTEVTVDLPTEALTSGVQIGFRMCDGYGYGVGIDDILLTAKPGAAPANENETQFLTWTDGEVETSIGANNLDFTAVIRFTAEDLANYDGKQLKKVSFCVNETSTLTSYTAKVWTGGSIVNDVYDTGTLVAEKSGSNAAEGWNEVELDTAVTIDSSEELWIGVNCVEYTGYPLSVSNNEAISGKSDIAYIDNSGWQTLADSSYNYAWCIRGILGEDDTAEISYTLCDSYGDGWNTNAIKIIDTDDGSEVATLTLTSGNEATGRLTLLSAKPISLSGLRAIIPMNVHLS
jgi:hypothetical protein